MVRSFVSTMVAKFTKHLTHKFLMHPGFKRAPVIIKPYEPPLYSRDTEIMMLLLAIFIVLVICKIITVAVKRLHLSRANSE